MNKRQAMIEAKKILGPDAVVIDNGPKCASSAEKRAEAREQLKRLAAICTTHELRKQHRKERDHWMGEAYRYRFQIGVHHGFAIGVRGSGDSWDDCFSDYRDHYCRLIAA